MHGRGNDPPVPHYRLHFTHPDGITTTDDHDSEQELAVGDTIDLENGLWEVQEVEPFGLQDYDALVAVVRADDEA